MSWEQAGSATGKSFGYRLASVLWRFALRALGLLLLWTLFTLPLRLTAGLFVERPYAGWLSLAVATPAAVWTWWYLRRWLGEISTAERTEQRASAELLRREDPARYKRILDQATHSESVTDPDAYVGRMLNEPKPRQHYAWTAPTSVQRTSVDLLTKQHGNVTLVRTVDAGAAELIGVKNDVGYRYRIDAMGVVTLLSSDDSQRKTLRVVRRLITTGILLFVGPFVPLLIWHREGSIPGWLVPIMIVGFVLGFFGLAANNGPKFFLDENESWQTHGSGWD